MAGRWDPWADVERRTEVTVVLAELPRGYSGAMCGQWADGSAIVVIDPGLDACERRVALAHELVHLERGIDAWPNGMPYAWRAISIREEERVHRAVARRLVPLDELEEFITGMEDLDLGVDARAVAEHFEVTEMAARTAMMLLAERREAA